MSSPFQSTEFPLAYLITFRTYGTWLHGDAKGSVDRKSNIYGTPRLSQNRTRQRAEQLQLKHSPILLNRTQRQVVKQAVREVCRLRRYALLAVNARTNHVHVVVSAACKPERIMEAFKGYSTRMLRRRGLLSEDIKPWVRHGSTRYLWKEQHVVDAIDYVLYSQGDDSLFE